jgi:hypothetical protein
MAKLLEVVDAAVEHDAKPKLRVEHWLLGCRREIENAQPTMTKTEIALDKGPGGVGSSGGHRPEHLGNYRGIFDPFGTDDPANAGSPVIALVESTY